MKAYPLMATIIKIVSGGQTGVDQIGLDTAIYCKIPHSGWCPKGRKSEWGMIPDKYNLQEHNSSSYKVRTQANVVDSDATLIITPANLTGGSLLTVKYCIKHGKPWHHISLTTTPKKKAINEIVKWLNGDSILNAYDDYVACPPEKCVLNIAGSRGSQCAEYEKDIFNLLVGVISKVNGKLFYPVG